MPRLATLYISWVAAAGLTVLAFGLSRWHSSDLPRFLAFLMLAVVASTQKIHLPRMKGTMSLSFLFILIGIADFSFAETLVLGCASGLIQSVWNTRHSPRGEQILFNMATLVLSAGFADWISHLVLSLVHTSSLLVLIALATCLFLLLNTALVAAVVSLTERKPFKAEWLHCFYWSFPYFLIGAVLASLVSETSRSAGWLVGLVILPLMYLSHLWYQAHVESFTQEQAVVAALCKFSPAPVRDLEPEAHSVLTETR